MTEDQFQAIVIDTISREFPQFNGKCFHVQNELIIPKRVNESPKQYNQRVLSIGAQNKRKGKLAGVPDILIKYHGILYSIELKVEGGVVSDNQIELHATWNADFPGIPIFTVKYTSDNDTLEQIRKICRWIIKERYVITVNPN